MRDAHSLFLESLAEFGLVGTAILAFVLAAPFAGLVRARRGASRPSQAAHTAAFLVHAGVDWDWELLAVPGAALVCAAAMLVAARPAAARPLGGAPTGALAVAVLAVAAFSFAGVVGYGALASAESAASERAHEQALTDADRAATWLPWSFKRPGSRRTRSSPSADRMKRAPRSREPSRRNRTTGSAGSTSPS